MAYKTLQNPGLYGVGNDYEQDKTYVVEFVDKDGKAVAPGTKGAKSTWRDGIYTKLAKDVKDPEGLNKRTVNVSQAKWGDWKSIDSIPPSAGSALSGETDGSALFTSGYATAVSFGLPFNTMTDAMKNFVDEEGTAGVEADYYLAPSADKVGIPQGGDVASFRQVVKKA